MSIDRVAMALDDVIKADRKSNKDKKAAAKATKNITKKASGGIKKKPIKKQRPVVADGIVKKVVIKALVQNGVVQGNKGIRRRSGRRAEKPLGMNQRSRTIVRRVVEAPARRQPRQTIIREVRYIHDSAPRERVVRRPAPRRRVVVVEESHQSRYGSVSSNSRRRPARRNNNSFNAPRNFLQRS